MIRALGLIAALWSSAAVAQMWQATNGTVTITASSRFAGAVFSLKRGGVEYIDAHDHGRELQTAVQWDGRGEVENPTQAGSLADGTGQTSRSVVLAAVASGNKYHVKTQMAYWKPWQGHALSPDVVVQDYTVGWGGLPNVVHVDMALHSAAAHKASLEAMTAYLPGTFRYFYVLKAGAWQPVQRPSVLTPRYAPIAISNGTEAMAVLGSGCPGDCPTYATMYYGGNGPAKWSTWHAFDAQAGGVYRYSADIVVGNLSEILDAIKALQ